MTTTQETPVATAMEMLDPATLTVDTNVRKEAELTPEFVASVKEHGVLVPVVGHRTENGTVHVLMGQRRTLAAVEVGLSAIPVHVVATPDEADRLATQVVENDHRRALTDGDRADAYHQLSLLGVSPTKIARRMGAKKQLVETALRVKNNETAAAALAQGITLEQSAVIEEFSDDAQAVAALERLAAEGNAGNFAHRAQRMRDDRTTKALVAEIATAAEAKGLTVLDADPNGWEYKGPAACIYELTTAEGEKLTDADADAVYIGTGYSGPYERLCVADWKARGLRKGGKAAAGSMSEEEKVARRTAIENNKAADSAEVVRREFVTSLLARKTAPKNAQAFIAHTLTHSHYIAGRAANHPDPTAELLGAGNDRAGLAKHLAKTTVKPEMVTLAIMCTAYEKSITRSSWKHTNAEDSFYLKQLEEWGYTLRN